MLERSLLTGCQSGMYKTTDHGTTWKKVFEKGSVNHIIENDGVLICTSSQGIWRSENAGDSWSKVFMSVNNPFYIQSTSMGLIAILPGQEILGQFGSNSVYTSTDKGLTWTPVVNPLPSSLNSVYAFAEAGSYLFACGNDGIYRSTDKGISWKLVYSGPDKMNFFRLVSTESGLYALLVQGC